MSNQSAHDPADPLKRYDSSKWQVQVGCGYSTKRWADDFAETAAWWSSSVLEYETEHEADIVAEAINHVYELSGEDAMGARYVQPESPPPFYVIERHIKDEYCDCWLRTDFPDITGWHRSPRRSGIDPKLGTLFEDKDLAESKAVELNAGAISERFVVAKFRQKSVVYEQETNP